MLWCCLWGLLSGVCSAGGAKLRHTCLQLLAQLSASQLHDTHVQCCAAQVKLRDVVDYVSDILAFNSATSAAGALLPAASDAIAAQLKGVRALHCMAALAVLGVPWMVHQRHAVARLVGLT